MRKRSYFYSLLKKGWERRETLTASSLFPSSSSLFPVSSPPISLVPRCTTVGGGGGAAVGAPDCSSHSFRTIYRTHTTGTPHTHSPHPSSTSSYPIDDDDDVDSTPSTSQSQSSRSSVTPVNKELMEKECTQITLRGVWCNVGLAIFKLVGGVVGHSHALIADAAHSLSDLLTDGITLWAARISQKPPDADHPFGHGKLEAIGSLTIAVTLAATAGGIGWSAIVSINSILNGASQSTPTAIALVAAVVSIAVKELLYHATLRVGKKWNSKVVKANAWHHRSDSVSTLVALIGVGGAMIQVPVLDPIAGAFVTGLILKAALELGYDSLKDLTDESVDASLLTAVSSLLSSMRSQGVESFHRLRGRSMGPFIVMDCHIQVDPTISVSAAQQIAERVRILVRRGFPQIAEFSVHVDVADYHRGRSLFSNMEEEISETTPTVKILSHNDITAVVNDYISSRERLHHVEEKTKKEGIPPSPSSVMNAAASHSAKNDTNTPSSTINGNAAKASTASTVSVSSSSECPPSLPPS